MDFALDSIIDAIENNSLKLALSLCEKALKKWPNSLQAKALKSLALWYSGREEQSLSLVEDIASFQPRDYFTISVLEKILESRGNNVLLVSICENALKYDFDYRVAELLFNAHLKCRDTKKLYAVASKLYSSTKQNAYLFWVLVGLILDIQNQPDSVQKTTQIELSKRIISKIDVPSDSRLVQEFKQLSTIVYSFSCDHADLLQALTIKTKFSSSEESILKLKTLVDLNLHNDAIDLCRQYSHLSSTLDFSFWTFVLNLSLSIQDGLKFASEILAIFKGKEDVRTIDLASIELKRAFSNSNSANICQMIYDFVINYCNKPATVNDVILILKKLNFCDVESIFIKISKELSSMDENSLFENVSLLHLYRFIRHSFCFNSIHVDINSILKKLNPFFLNLDQFKLIDKKIEHLSFNYFSLAFFQCLFLLDEYVTNSVDSSCSYILGRIEKYSIIFEDRYVFNLLRLVLCIKSCRIDQAYACFRQLEIKCLQLDTLGYLILDHVVNLAAFENCNTICQESVRLYSSNQSDTWNLIAQSLDSRAYTSLIDFYHFSERLDNSIQNISCQINILKHAFSTMALKNLFDFVMSDKVQNIIKPLSTALYNCSDNRDLKILSTVDSCGNLKKLLTDMNFFKIEEAHYYFCIATLCRSYINNTQLDETCSSSISMILDPVNKLISQICVEKNLDFSSILSNASSIITILIDSIILKSSKFNQIVIYEDITAFSNFLLKFKEIIFIIYLKFKIQNLKSLNSIHYYQEFSSKLMNVKNIFIDYSNKLIIECDDHSNLINSLICWFEQLDVAIKTFFQVK